jgi:hypothetical protein
MENIQLDTDIQNDVRNKISWAMDLAYKIAVKTCGIYDWTNQFKTPEARTHATERVEDLQVQILPSVLSEVDRWEKTHVKIPTKYATNDGVFKVGDECPYCHEKIKSKNHYCDYG